MDMIRVGVYIDYGNVYHGARDAFNLHSEQGYVGNVNPMYLAKRVALQSPEPGAPQRNKTHTLAYAKVFRGAPDPNREPHAALMEAKRAAQWERSGCQVIRHSVDYARGNPVEKGIDVKVATTLMKDAMKREAEVFVLVSADKDFTPALNDIRDVGIEVETAIWVAIPGAQAVGRIRLEADRQDLGPAPFHGLSRSDFGRVKDEIDYRYQPLPPGWNAAIPASAHRTDSRQIRGSRW